MDTTTVDTKQDVKTTSTFFALQSELEHYRKQSETLQKMNILHQRMAGIHDLPTMIEAYSIWMMEHIPHDLIGYFNPAYQKMHMYCSSHGPERRLAIGYIERLLHRSETDNVSTRLDNLFTFAWSPDGTDSNGRFVIMRKDYDFTLEEQTFIKNTLAIAAAPLERALEFEEVYSQVRRDTLTGLPNRFVFEERIDAIIEQARRYGHPLTLAALDLDHFKAVNDTMGHIQGDKILQQVASVLHQQIRQSDLLVRMGGDEFLLILPDTRIQEAEHLAERLCTAVEQLHIMTQAGQLGVSIGLAQWRNDMTREKWLETADDILYQAKARGRARVAVR